MQAVITRTSHNTDDYTYHNMSGARIIFFREDLWKKYVLKNNSHNISFDFYTEYFFFRFFVGRGMTPLTVKDNTHD